MIHAAEHGDSSGLPGRLNWSGRRDQLGHGGVL